MLMAIEILHNVILIGCFVAVSFYNFNSSTPLLIRKGKGAVVFNLNGIKCQHFERVYPKRGPRDLGLLVEPETQDPSHRWDL